MRTQTKPFRVAIDLAGLDTTDFRLRFVEGLIRHAADVEFVLLTRPTTPAINAPHVQQAFVPGPGPLDDLMKRLDARMPGQARRARLGRELALPQRVRRAQSHWSPFSRLRVDVVFCPFAPSRVRDGVTPMVAAVHDLQHEASPHLLRSSQRATRARDFEVVARGATRVVCASHEVAETALRHKDVQPQSVTTLRPGRLLIEPTPRSTTRRPDGEYLLVPGDLGPRHNHRLVLTAFAQFCARNPDSSLKLVCATNADTRLSTAINNMGIAEKVRFTTASTSELIEGCRATLVPSLYETIGEGVLQAMASGRPVVCSRLRSLVELTGDSALTFDPHQPADLLQQLERIEHEPDLPGLLAEGAQAQLSRLDDPATVADQYVTVLREAQCQASFR